MKRSALVLVVVLWVLVALSALCLSLGVAARGLGKKAIAQRAAVDDDVMLASAINMVRLLIATDEAAFDHLGEPCWASTALNYQLQIGDSESYILRASDAMALEYGMIDSASRLNANTASAEMLAKLTGFDIESAQRFVELRQQLTQDIQTYAGQIDAPVAGRTGAISSRAQLAGMLSAALQRPAGTSAAASGGNYRGLDSDIARLMELLTIESRSANRSADAAARVNLNSADIDALTQSLSSALTDQQIAAIVASVAEQPLGSAAELLERPLTLENTEGQAVGVDFDLEDFANICDLTTCSDSSHRTGLVNINTASQQVLEALPPLAGGYGELLVEYRNSADPQSLSSIIWPAHVLPQSVYVELVPYITVRSSQFRFVVVSHNAASATAQWAEVVIQRDIGQSSVIALERWRQIWHDPFTNP